MVVDPLKAQHVVKVYLNHIDLNALHNVYRVYLLLRCASTFLTKILDWTGKVKPVYYVFCKTITFQELLRVLKF